MHNGLLAIDRRVRGDVSQRVDFDFGLSLARSAGANYGGSLLKVNKRFTLIAGSYRLELAIAEAAQNSARFRLV